MDIVDNRERNLTISNPIIYTANCPTRTGDSKQDARSKYEVPSVHFVYFLETKHDKIVINCKESSKLLSQFSRVDVDVYISPLSYDYKAGQPLVEYKNKPKNFHIKVLVPGTIPQPTDDRPPYGLGEEVSLESLSLTSESPQKKEDDAKLPLVGPQLSTMSTRVKGKSLEMQQQPTASKTRQLHATVSSSSSANLATHAAAGSPKSGAGKKRRRSGTEAEEEPEGDGEGHRPPETRSAKRQSLARNCKLTEAPKDIQTSTRSTRRKPNPAYT
ncbi:hypothetical protein HDE_13144 [Halotydeus destructor]|nr:hypothetical protein HDE_13144 [Halotydeus destructor]